MTAPKYEVSVWERYATEFALALADTPTRIRAVREAYYVHDHREYKLPSVTTAGYESILTPVSTRRDTFELRISRTHLKFGMPQ